MIAEIERAVIQWLTDHWQDIEGQPMVGQFDIGKDFSDINSTIAISISTEMIGIKRNADGSLNFAPVISIYMVFKNVGRPDQRRAGIYPILEATAVLITGKKFDLDIEPMIPSGSAQEIYHDKLKEIGSICYRMQFTTNFDGSAIDDSDAVRLITDAITYYDGATEAVVAEDEINFDS